MPKASRNWLSLPSSFEEGNGKEGSIRNWIFDISLSFPLLVFKMLIEHHAMVSKALTIDLALGPDCYLHYEKIIA